MGRADAKGVKAASLEVGDLAPDFDLPALVGGVKQRFRLSDQRGKKHIVLAFYPFNWEDESAQQLCRYQLERDSFQVLGAETVAICVESIMNTTVWEREIGPFDFPLCSDFWPHGEVAQRYGVLVESGDSKGSSERAIFVVDKSGRIVFRRCYGPNEVPRVKESLEALREI